MSKKVREIKEESHLLPIGLQGKIRSLSYRAGAKIGIPGTYSSAEVNFEASVECDPSDNPAVLKTQLMSWVDKIVNKVSEEKYEYWKEKLHKTHSRG